MAITMKKRNYLKHLSQLARDVLIGVISALISPYAGCLLISLVVSVLVILNGDQVSHLIWI